MDPYREAIETRIRELIRFRRWLRDRQWTGETWTQLDREYRLETHALLRVRSAAKRHTKVAA